MLVYEDVVLGFEEVELENMLEGHGLRWGMQVVDRLWMDLIAMFQRR